MSTTLVFKKDNEVESHTDGLPSPDKYGNWTYAYHETCWYWVAEDANAWRGKTTRAKDWIRIESHYVPKDVRAAALIMG